MRQEQTNKIIPEIDPPANLKKAVFARIAKERQKQIFRRRVLFFGGFSISIISLFASIGFFGRNIIASDFWSIGSLVFTDMQVVAMYWQEYALSLLETFPVEALAFVLIPMFALLVLAKQYSEFLRNYKMFKVQKI